MSDVTTHDDPTRGLGSPASWARLILSSWMIRLTIITIVVFGIVYSIETIPLAFRELLSSHIGPIVFLTLTVISCVGGPRKRRSSEQMFWRIMAIAFGFWLLIRTLLPYLKPIFPLGVGIGGDILYALYYLTMILGIELRPHLGQASPFSSLERVVTWPVISLFILGLLVYFVFIPLSVTPHLYATYVSSMYFFLALDIYIGLRLAVLSLRVRAPGWKVGYGFLSVAMFGFACGDLLEMLQYRDAIDYSLGSPFDLIWLLPFLGVVAAARLQPRLESTLPGEPPDLFDPQQQLVILALVLPVIHFLGYGFGLFNDAGHALREIVSLFWLVLLGSLAFTQQTLLQKRSRTLAEKTDEANRLLQQSERMVRLMSDRQKAQDAQRQSEINFSRVFNASPDPMAIVTREEGSFLEVNESFERFWGGGRSQIVGATIRQLGLIHPRDLSTLLQTTSDGRGAHDFPAHVRTSGEQVRQCLIGAEPIEFGGKSSVVLAIRDVTEQIELEAFRDSLISQLESKNAELERFTYTVSHDLKSPLITIKGFLGFLDEDLRSGKKDRLEDDLRRINDAADRMQRLLDELLELSRVGRIVNDPEPIPLADLVRESIELVRGRLDERKARVVVENQDRMPVIHGDRVRLLEVFQNLLENAIKFMGTQHQPTIVIDWSKLEESRQVSVSVSDNGIGIDPRFHKKVFGLFEQLESDQSGTGIGLALVKRIIELHHGRIDVSSEGTGQGTTFTFTLPLAPPAAEETL